MTIATFNHGGALLDCCFSDAMHAFRFARCFALPATHGAQRRHREQRLRVWRAVSGGGGGDACRYDLGATQQSVLGTHEAPVRSVVFAPAAGVLVSGSWDRTTKLWDVRSGQLVAHANQPDKARARRVASRSPPQVFTMAVSGDNLIVGTVRRDAKGIAV